MREVAELKSQLKLVEESRDSFRHNLLDVNQQLREGQRQSKAPFTPCALTRVYASSLADVKDSERSHRTRRVTSKSKFI